MRIGEPLRDVYDVYLVWCKEKGYAPMYLADFMASMARHTEEKWERTPGGQWIMSGVALK